MQTDLFLALLDKENPRGHPILAALLYAYCPAAARWWLAGAEPVDPGTPDEAAAPFDPAWQALADLAAGGTLREALGRHGFETLVEEARVYVTQVDAWRARHADLPSPERLPTFKGGRLEQAERFGLQEEIKAFGGSWENFFGYVRTWAFMVPDWERALRFAEPPNFASQRLALTVRGVRRPAFVPAWAWVSTMGKSTRRVIGLLAAGGEADQLLMGLVGRAGPAGEKAWPAPAEVWVLDTRQGEAAPGDLRIEAAALPGVVAWLARLAQEGPHAPLRALQGPARCAACGFRTQCYLPSGELSPLALA